VNGTADLPTTRLTIDLPLANERGDEVGDGQAEPTTALGLRNVEDLTDEVAAIDAQR
jgi:hypothetical protein